MACRYLALLISITLFAVCGPNSVPDAQKDTNASFTVRRSPLQRVIVGDGDFRIEQQASSVNQFAVNMYTRLIEDGKNLFFSPYSITCALGMTDAGAKGITHQQIRTALSLALEGDDFHAALNGLNQTLTAHADTVENLDLSVENSIWVQDGLPLGISFLNTLSKHYDAGVNLLNFKESPEPSRIIINDWVSLQTHERIQNLIPPGAIDNSTRVVLTNAIYFLADWYMKFDPQKTKEKSFYLPGGGSVTVPMMKMEPEENENGGDGIKLLYSQTASAKALELPYRGNRIVMDLILPAGDLNQFESNLSPQIIADLVNRLHSTALITVQIPRFQFTTSSMSLVKAFKDMGMELPFSGSADFSGITDEVNLYISEILHKAFIKVDEAGTEAAAATVVIMNTTSTNPPPPPQFIAERPFIYLIRDTQTGMILFMGRVLDPTMEQ